MCSVLSDHAVDIDFGRVPSNQCITFVIRTCWKHYLTYVLIFILFCSNHETCSVVTVVLSCCVKKYVVLSELIRKLNCGLNIKGYWLVKWAPWLQLSVMESVGIWDCVILWGCNTAGINVLLCCFLHLQLISEVRKLIKLKLVGFRWNKNAIWMGISIQVTPTFD